VPQLNILEDINIPKILDNKLGVFSTKIINEDIQSVSLNKEIKQNGKLNLKISHDLNNNNNNNMHYKFIS
jgi:hypothetical protein